MQFFQGKIINYFVRTNEKNNNLWNHQKIVNLIKKENPFLISTLAIIPDTREINSFNFEAEAARQGEFVIVRQVVSNEKTYKDDLKYFDWFLIKSGDQGVMTSESKLMLTTRINFKNFKIKKNLKLQAKILPLFKKKMR